MAEQEREEGESDEKGALSSHDVAEPGGEEEGRSPSPAFTPPERSELPELFFALVGPVGTDLQAVADALERELAVVGYRTAPIIKLSDCLHALRPYQTLAGIKNAREHIDRHMSAGNEVRKSLEHGSAVAALGVAKIKEARGGPQRRPTTAYVINSLKHPAEVDFLREVYGPLLFVIAVFDSEEKRRSRLTLRLEKQGTPLAEAENAATKLMERDEEELEEPDFGQDVRHAFPKADVFIDGHRDLDGRDVDAQVKRFVRLLFGDHEQGPTKAEYAMAIAHAAARRSGDLSRQVGAAIMDRNGEVLSLGCNEVPRPGGGVYWCGDLDDGRDIALGKDPNAVMGSEILRELFKALQGSGFLSPDLAGVEDEEIVARVRAGGVLENARVAALIEFGRVVHAEMNALSHAARTGISVDDALLYCSTFPCHICARHILAAGISTVIYIEPYPKSLAEQLYPGAIRRDGPTDRSERDQGGDHRERALVFRPFAGMAPSLYLSWFKFGNRKDAQGYAVRFDTKSARPRVSDFRNAHRLLENEVTDTLQACTLARGW